MYEGRELIRSDEFPTCDSTTLRVVFEGTSSEWPQAVMLDSDLPMEINGQKGLSFALWSNSAPTEVLVACDPREEHVWVHNAWDSGSGSADAWIGAAAMIVEELSTGRRYRCNDAYPDDDFDDLVFRIERVG